MSTMAEVELHTLTGAYAVDALPGTEREEFERHLAACPACAQEVRELSATAERLGLAVAAVPPPELKERVLRQVSTVRQEAPGSQSPDRAGGTVPGGSGGGTGRRARALPRFLLAACVAAAAAFGGAAVWQYSQAQDARQEAQEAHRQSRELTRVLAAPDAKTRSSSDLPGGARASVVVSHKEDKAAFVASGMEKPPSGKVYQLWFADGDTMRPAGLLESAAGGDAVLMDGEVGKATGMGITVEPAGGSQQPTSDPLALMTLPGKA